MKKHTNISYKGFTLLEILLVVVAIGILAGITILALNPSKQIGQTNDAQRKVDVNTIINAIYQYSLDNNGSIPASIATGTCGDTATEICKTGGTCTGIVDLSVLTTNEEYIVELPTDPTASTTNGTGYYVVKTSNDRVQVCAPNAQQVGTISVKR